MMLQNPEESSGIVGKNFRFDLRIAAFHRLEAGNRIELARCIAVAVVGVQINFEFDTAIRSK